MVKSSKTSILQSYELSKKEQKRLGIELVDTDYTSKNYHHQNYGCGINDTQIGWGVILTLDIKKELIEMDFIVDCVRTMWKVNIPVNTDKSIFLVILENGIKLLQSLEK